jgi:hypothetical protein
VVVVVVGGFFCPPPGRYAVPGGRVPIGGDCSIAPVAAPLAAGASIAVSVGVAIAVAVGNGGGGGGTAGIFSGAVTLAATGAGGVTGFCKANL